VFQTKPSLNDRLHKAIEEECAEIKRHPTNPDWHLCRRNQSWIVADLLIQSRDHAAAARAACAMGDECDEHWQECYDAACLLARCVALVREDGTLGAAERSRLSRSYTTQAVRFLKRAIEKGFDEVKTLSKDPDLDPLRSYRGFRVFTSTLRTAPRSGEQR
jgi:hypothetical protein